MTDEQRLEEYRAEHEDHADCTAAFLLRQIDALRAEVAGLKAEVQLLREVLKGEQWVRREELDAALAKIKALEAS